MSSQAQGNGGHTENRQIVDRRTKEEDDKIETKSEGKDGALQLQKVIDH
jgi:hypothetical protein